MAAAQTPERERKGPWANRVLSTDIEKTPEYDDFIKKLSAYHQKRGLVVLVWKSLCLLSLLTRARPNFLYRTTLTVEPELGRKLLDLRKLYEKVTALGGYDKVTEEKGKTNDDVQEGEFEIDEIARGEHRSLERSCPTVQARR